MSLKSMVGERMKRGTLPDCVYVDSYAVRREREQLSSMLEEQLRVRV